MLWDGDWCVKTILNTLKSCEEEWDTSNKEIPHNSRYIYKEKNMKCFKT